jgi:hypothetical protein
MTGFQPFLPTVGQLYGLIEYYYAVTEQLVTILAPLKPENANWGVKKSKKIHCRGFFRLKPLRLAKLAMGFL